MTLARTTPEFDERSLPQALRSSHKVATGVWGNLIVRSGSIDFVFDDDGRRRTLAAGEAQPIPPERVHHLDVIGPVALVIEFYTA